MTNTTLNKQFNDIAFIAILAIVSLNWFKLGLLPNGLDRVLIGAILIGLNIVKHYNGLAMSKFWFLAGAFVFATGALQDATLKNPAILPIVGILLAANAVYAALENRQKAA